MNINILVDFDVINSNSITQNIDMLKKLAAIHDIYLLISDNQTDEVIKLNIDDFIKKIIKETDKSIIKKIQSSSDWVIYFKKGIKEVTIKDNLVLCPIDLKGNLDAFKNISFTEHARYKKYYNEFSDYYMYTLSNDTEKESNFLINVFKKYLGKNTGKVLDCGCGVGRHSYFLANKDFDVTGIDFSVKQINNAKKIHNHKNVKYQQMDIRDIKLPIKDFDMSYCLWSTYNYLSQEEDFKKFIISNYNHQKKGSLLILDGKNIPILDSHRLYNSIVEKDTFKMEIIVNKYIFNNIQNSQFFWFINDNNTKKFLYDDDYVRFYSINELKELMSNYYELVDVYGDFDMNYFNENSSNRIITIFRRL